MFEEDNSFWIKRHRFGRFSSKLVTEPMVACCRGARVSWEANLGLLHRTHGVDGVQTPKAGRVLRSKDQLGQMFSCMERQMDPSYTDEVNSSEVTVI